MADSPEKMIIKVAKMTAVLAAVGLAAIELIAFLAVKGVSGSGGHR